MIDRRTFDRRSRLDVIVYACHLRLVNGYHKKTSELLKQADAEAYVDLKTMKHKAGEKIYDAGRKFALVAPRWVFQEAVGVATLLLGPLGSLVDFGLDKALDKGKELINERHRKDPEAADVANGCITPTASGRPRSTASRTRI